MRHIITAAAVVAAFAAPAWALTDGSYGDRIAISVRAITAPFYRTECASDGSTKTCKQVWYSEVVGYTITARDGREVYVPLDMLIAAGVGKEQLERLPGW
jgi:hypothetical protein